MANFTLSKFAPSPRELDTRPILDDYRPKKERALLSSDVDSENYQIDELNEQDYLEASTGISSQVNLHKLEHELSRDPLGEIAPPKAVHPTAIATMVRALTYGEMIELAQAIWKIRPEGGGVDQDTLPMLLHRWSTSSEH